MSNTEWCESFNSVVSAENVFSNKHSPSRDIATKFGVEESIRNICLGISDKFGAGLVELYQSEVVPKFLGKHMKSEKSIYQPGTLRKAIASCTLLMPPSLKSSTRQEIGLFWGGFQTGESSYCTVQVLDPETAIPQGCILDEFDCPLLTMVDFFHVSLSFFTFIAIAAPTANCDSFGGTDQGVGAGINMQPAYLSSGAHLEPVFMYKGEVCTGRSRYEKIANLSEDEDEKEDVAKAMEDGTVLHGILRL
ncbi:hypothetical protein EMCRGX_G029548 [Ephydatia muelleri]